MLRLPPALRRLEQERAELLALRRGGIDIGLVLELLDDGAQSGGERDDARALARRDWQHLGL